MADKTTEKKECKRCHEKKLFKFFVKSAVAKSGRLGYCTECWPKMVSHKNSMNKRKPKANPVSNGHNVVQAANDALKAAGYRKERFLVKATGVHNEFAEFVSEDKALRQAMEWKMKGLPVTVWRQCEFEMVLRIIG